MKQKYLIHILTLLFSVVSSEAQIIVNRVPNYSFEYYDTCPDNMGQIQYARPWTQPLLYSTSEFFHLCNDFNLIITNNQGPKTGSGIAAIGMDRYSNMGEYKEYIQVELADALKPDYRYCVSFYVSLGGFSRYGIAEIGCYFSDTQITASASVTLPYTPQIINTSGPLMDTTVWMPVIGSFVADGGEKWITVGSFAPGSQITWVMNYGNHSENNYFAYYFLDDFSLYECNQPIPAFAGNDSTICKGSPVELGTGQWDDFVYQWVSSTGEEFTEGQPVVRPQTTTTYYLTQTDRWGGVARDTVHITVYDCDTLYIPNSFTPNGDFVNDCFEIVNPGNLLYRIKIWNRWGSLVFEGNESSCWDGSFQSTGLQQGVYMYQISILTPGVMKNRYQGYVVILI